MVPLWKCVSVLTKRNSDRIIYGQFLDTVCLLRLLYDESDCYDYESDCCFSADVLKDLLKTRRKKINMFKASRTKTSIFKGSDFKLSDEEEETIRPKKVSFLKSQRNSDNLKSDALRSDTPRSDTLRSDALGSDTLRSDALRSDTPRSDTLRSDRSVNEAQSRDRSHQDSEFTSHSESPVQWNSQSESPSVRKSQSESSACRRSLSESPLPLYSENSQWESSSECEFPPPQFSVKVHFYRSSCSSPDLYQVTV